MLDRERRESVNPGQKIMLRRYEELAFGHGEQTEQGNKKGQKMCNLIRNRNLEVHRSSAIAMDESVYAEKDTRVAN